MDWGGTIDTVPNGWFLCNGLLVSRTGQAALFAAIGTTWGAGDGISTFALPDLVGKFRKGAAAVPGVTGGNSSITLGTNQLPSHSHGITDPGHDHTITDPGHVHSVTDPEHAHVQQVIADPLDGVVGSRGSSTPNGTSIGTTDTSATGITVDSVVTGITGADSNITGIADTDLTGNGDPVDIEPLNATILPIIKA